MRYTLVVLVCLIHTFFRSMRCWYVCLASFAPPTWLSLLLCFFASLHTCLHVHTLVCVSSIFQSNGTTDTQSKPIFILLGHHLLFNNMLVCFFMCFTWLYALVWHLLLANLLACSFYHLFLCLSAGLLLLFLQVHAWSEGATSQAWAKREKMQAHKGQGLVN